MSKPSSRKALFALLALMAANLSAQTDRGVITGTVKDATGAAVTGAQVTAVHRGTDSNYKTVSTASGDFTIPSLPVGTYQLRVESPGFKTHVRDNVLLAGGTTLRLDAELELGTTLQTVEVTEVVQMLQSENARVSTQVVSKLVDELPLVVGGTMRSPFDLANITGDVGGTATQNDNNFRIGGGRPGRFGMTLDGISSLTSFDTQNAGIDMVNQPSVDAITEFAVTSGGFKAEFSHASGGSVSFVSKSGTNEFHGSAYEFLRNNALDARPFFSAVKPVYRQHDFGATIGGPFWIPKVYNGKNKTFIFFSYEGFRNRVGATPTPYSVPPPEFYNGDLRNWVDQANKLIQVYDPATQSQVNGTWTRQPFANNQIPQARFDSFSKVVMPYLQAAKPNVAATPGTSGYVRNNYISYGVSLTPFNKESVKLDHYLTPKQRLAFYFGRTEKTDTAGSLGAPGLPGLLNNFQAGWRNSDVYRLSWDYTITPRLLNRFNTGGNNWRESHQNVAQGQGWKDKVCMKNVADCDVDLTLVDFGGEFNLMSGYASNGSDNIVVEFNDDMTRISGRHTFKWGYAYNNTHYNGIGQQNVSGYTNFNRLSTSVPLVTNQATGGGSAFTSYLLGAAYNAAVDTPRFIPTQFRYHGGYFQDDWRVSSRFTLNFGIRYEFHLPPLTHGDMFSEFDPLLPNPGAGGLPGAMRFAGFGPGRENKRVLNPGWWGGIGPRLGLSYSLDKKSVLRASFSRSFGAVRTGDRHTQGFLQQWTIANLDQGLTPTFQYADGMPAWPRPPFIDPTVANGQGPSYNQGKEASRLPEELNYVLNIQRQLSNNMVLELGYNGVVSSHLQGNSLGYNQLNPNQLAANLNPFTPEGRALLNSSITSPAAMAAGLSKPYANFTGSVAQALRQFPQYQTIAAEARGGHATYHSMMLKLEKRYSVGLTFQGSYVFSKTLTDADVGGLPLDNFNRRLEKSIAPYDQTHQVKLSYVYELPAGRGKKFLSSGLASQVLGGWHIGVVQWYLSGTPLPMGTTIGFPIFSGGNRPTVSTYDGWRAPVKGTKFDPAADSFFQPASFFGPQPTTQFGNMTRYNPKLRNFPDFNENISLAKSFYIFGERTHVDVRWEAFNLFNRARFGALGGGTTLQDPNFGLWRTQINNPRQMQLALKLYW